jgi:large subunit ribosomal protein L5
MENKTRLEKLYDEKIRPALQKELSLRNVMQVPEIRKIVLNVGIKEAVGDSKVIQSVMDVVAKIAGQQPVKTKARHSIASFKLREGMPIGVKVTLRRRRMYEFLDRLLNLAIPKIRDFQGLATKCDGRGNYNLGISDWTIFPEIEYEVGGKIYGLNITIETTTDDDKYAIALLKSFGMPFREA